LYATFNFSFKFLYFGTIVASVVVENVVSDRRPMKFEITDNFTISGTYISYQIFASHVIVHIQGKINSNINFGFLRSGLWREKWTEGFVGLP